MSRAPSPISLSLKPTLNARLRQLSKEEDRSLVSVITRLLLKGLAYEEAFGKEPIGTEDAVGEQVLRHLTPLRRGTQASRAGLTSGAPSLAGGPR